MITKLWGPSMWKSLHAISFCYPNNPSEEDKKNYKTFFKLIQFLLPCDDCRNSYSKIIKTGLTLLDDQVLENRYTLTKWLYDVHETVNRKLGVDYDISFDDVVKKYESYRATNVCYSVAVEKECNVIPYKIAKHFVKYAKERNVDAEEFYLINTKINKNSNEWHRRNKECGDIVDNMRINGIKSLEEDGIWKDLPTIDELKLILRLSSNLSKKQLINIIKNKFKCEYKKIYRLVK